MLRIKKMVLLQYIKVCGKFRGIDSIIIKKFERGKMIKAYQRLSRRWRCVAALQKDAGSVCLAH